MSNTMKGKERKVDFKTFFVKLFGDSSDLEIEPEDFIKESSVISEKDKTALINAMKKSDKRFEIKELKPQKTKKINSNTIKTEKVKIEANKVKKQTTKSNRKTKIQDSEKEITD